MSDLSKIENQHEPQMTNKLYVYKTSMGNSNIQRVGLQCTVFFFSDMPRSQNMVPQGAEGLFVALIVDCSVRTVESTKPSFDRLINLIKHYPIL